MDRDDKQMTSTKKTQTNSWRDEYPVHPCADVFPMMSQPELLKLAEDIKQHGLQQVPVLWEDPTNPDKAWLLDGRNRLEALALLERQGGPPWEGSAMFVNVTDPAMYIISANIRRRHLTKAQQAELIIKTIRANQKSVKTSDRPKFSQSGKSMRLNGSVKDAELTQAVEIAARHGISRGTVKIARAKLKGQLSAPKKKIGVSKQPPKNHAIPLGVRGTRAARHQSGKTPLWQRDLHAAILRARQVVSEAETRRYILSVLEQESVAS